MALNFSQGFIVGNNDPIDSRIVFNGRPWLNPLITHTGFSPTAYEGLLAVDTSDDTVWVLTNINNSTLETGWTQFVSAAVANDAIEYLAAFPVSPENNEVIYLTTAAVFNTVNFAPGFYRFDNTVSPETWQEVTPSHTLISSGDTLPPTAGSEDGQLFNRTGVTNPGLYIYNAGNTLWVRIADIGGGAAASSFIYHTIGTDLGTGIEIPHLGVLAIDDTHQYLNVAVGGQDVVTANIATMPAAEAFFTNARNWVRLGDGSGTGGVSIPAVAVLPFPPTAGDYAYLISPNVLQAVLTNAAILAGTSIILEETLLDETVETDVEIPEGLYRFLASGDWDRVEALSTVDRGATLPDPTALGFRVPFGGKLFQLTAIDGVNQVGLYRFNRNGNAGVWEYIANISTASTAASDFTYFGFGDVVPANTNIGSLGALVLDNTHQYLNIASGEQPIVTANIVDVATAEAFFTNATNWIRLGDGVGTGGAQVHIIGSDLELRDASLVAVEGDLLYTTADVQEADTTAPLDYGDPATSALIGEATVSDFTQRLITTPVPALAPDTAAGEELVIGFQIMGDNTLAGVLDATQVLLVVGEVFFINNERYEILRLGTGVVSNEVIAYLDNTPSDGTGIIAQDSRIFFPSATLPANTLYLRNTNAMWEAVEALTQEQKDILGHLSITNIGTTSILHAEHLDVNDLTHNGDAFVAVAADSKSVHIGGETYSQVVDITDVTNPDQTLSGQYLRATTTGVETTPDGEFINGSFSGTVTGQDPIHGTDLVNRRWSEQQARANAAVIDAYITEILALYTDVIPDEVTEETFVLRDEARAPDASEDERHVGVAGFRQYVTPTRITATSQDDWFGYVQGTVDRPGNTQDGYPTTRTTQAIDFRPMFALGLNNSNIDTDSRGRATAHYPPFETIDVSQDVILRINGSHAATDTTVNFIAQPGVIEEGDLVGHSFTLGGVIHQIVANTVTTFTSLQQLGTALGAVDLTISAGINFIEHVPGNFGNGDSNGDIQASRSFGFGGEVIQSLPADPDFLFIPERNHQASLDVVNPLGGYKNPLFTFTTPTSIQGGIEQRFGANFGQPATEGRLLNPGEAGGPKGFLVNMSLQLREDADPSNVPYPIWSIETGSEQQAFGLWYIPYGWNGNIPNSSVTNVSFIDNGRFRDVTPDNRFFPNGLHGQLGEVAFLITSSGDFNNGHNNNDSRAHFRARPRIVRLPAFETRPEEFRRVDLSTWTDLSFTFYEKIEHNHRTVFFRMSASEVTNSGKVTRINNLDVGSTGQYTNHHGESFGNQTIWNKPGGIKFQFGASSGINVDSTTNHDNIRFPGFMSDVLVSSVVPNADGQFVDPANPNRTWLHFITDAANEEEGYKNSLRREVLYPIHIARLSEARVPGVSHTRNVPSYDPIGRVETAGEFVVTVQNPIDQVDRINNETIYRLIGDTGQEVNGVRSLLTIPHDEAGDALDTFDTDGNQNIIDIGIPLDGHENITQRRPLRSNELVPLEVTNGAASAFAGADFDIQLTDANQVPGTVHSPAGINDFDRINVGAFFHFSGGGEGRVVNIDTSGVGVVFSLVGTLPGNTELVRSGSVVKSITSRSVDRDFSDIFMEEFYTPNITADRVYTRFRVAQEGTGNDLVTTLVLTESNDVWGRDPSDPQFRDPTVKNSPPGTIDRPTDDLIFYSYDGLNGLQNLNGRFAGTSNWDIANADDIARVYIPQFRGGFTSDGVHINLNPRTELIRATFVSTTDENDRIERDFSIEPLETDLAIGQVGISRRGSGERSLQIPAGYETEPRFALADDRWRTGLNTPIVIFSNRVTQLPAPLENEVVDLRATDPNDNTSGVTVIESSTIAALLGDTGAGTPADRFFMNISGLPVTIGPYNTGTTTQAAENRYEDALQILTGTPATWREIGTAGGGGGGGLDFVRSDRSLTGTGTTRDLLSVNVSADPGNIVSLGVDGGVFASGLGGSPARATLQFAGTSSDISAAQNAESLLTGPTSGTGTNAAGTRGVVIPNISRRAVGNPDILVDVGTPDERLGDTTAQYLALEDARNTPTNEITTAPWYEIDEFTPFLHNTDNGQPGEFFWRDTGFRGRISSSTFTQTGGNTDTRVYQDGIAILNFSNEVGTVGTGIYDAAIFELIPPAGVTSTGVYMVPADNNTDGGNRNRNDRTSFSGTNAIFTSTRGGTSRELAPYVDNYVQVKLFNGAGNTDTVNSLPAGTSSIGGTNIGISHDRLRQGQTVNQGASSWSTTRRFIADMNTDIVNGVLFPSTSQFIARAGVFSSGFVNGVLNIDNPVYNYMVVNASDASLNFMSLRDNTYQNYAPPQNTVAETITDEIGRRIVEQANARTAFNNETWSYNSANNTISVEVDDTSTESLTTNAGNQLYTIIVNQGIAGPNFRITPAAFNAQNIQPDVVNLEYRRFLPNGTTLGPASDIAVRIPGGLTGQNLVDRIAETARERTAEVIFSINEDGLGIQSINNELHPINWLVSTVTRTGGTAGISVTSDISERGDSPVEITSRNETVIVRERTRIDQVESADGTTAEIARLVGWDLDSPAGAVFSPTSTYQEGDIVSYDVGLSTNVVFISTADQPVESSTVNFVQVNVLDANPMNVLTFRNAEDKQLFRDLITNTVGSTADNYTLADVDLPTIITVSTDEQPIIEYDAGTVFDFTPVDNLVNVSPVNIADLLTNYTNIGISVVHSVNNVTVPNTANADWARFDGTSSVAIANSGTLIGSAAVINFGNNLGATFDAVTQTATITGTGGGGGGGLTVIRSAANLTTLSGVANADLTDGQLIAIRGFTFTSGTGTPATYSGLNSNIEVSRSLALANEQAFGQPAEAQIRLDFRRAVTGAALTREQVFNILDAAPFNADFDGPFSANVQLAAPIYVQIRDGGGIGFVEVEILAFRNDRGFNSGFVYARATPSVTTTPATPLVPGAFGAGRAIRASLTNPVLPVTLNDATSYYWDIMDDQWVEL